MVLSKLYSETLFVFTGYAMYTKYSLELYKLKKQVKCQFFPKYLYSNEDRYTHKHNISR